MDKTRSVSTVLISVALGVLVACVADPIQSVRSNPENRPVDLRSIDPTPSTARFKTGKRINVFGVSFELPSDFVRTQSSSGKDEARRYSCLERGTYIVVIADPRAVPDRLRQIDEQLESRPATRFRSGRLDGKRYDYTDEDGFRNLAVRIDSASHSFIFHAATNESDLRIANHFLRSIRSADDSSGIEDTDEPKDEDGDEINTKFEPGRGRSGPGDRGPDGFEPRPAEVAKTPNPDKLTILAKPRPVYPALALIYHIEGSVILRANFNADGTIEYVETVKALPFGLTGSAIRAMRKIKFKPQKKDGKPESVETNVGYTFTIYGP